MRAVTFIVIETAVRCMNHLMTRCKGPFYKKEVTGMETIFSQYLAPISVVGTYLVIRLLKKYLFIDNKYYLLISVVVGMLIYYVEMTISSIDVISVLITGGLSGMVFYFTYYLIKKIL